MTKNEIKGAICWFISINGILITIAIFETINPNVINAIIFVLLLIFFFSFLIIGSYFILDADKRRVE